MKYALRKDQSDFLGDVHGAWNNGARDVCGVASTGFGKTVCLGHLVEQHPGASAVIAHRQELVSQISMTLAGYGVRHNIIAADATIRAIAAQHVAEYGTCFHTPSARAAVASVDTLVRRDDPSWEKQVTLTIPDEGHHVIRGNKWGRALDKFTHPHRRGLLPTATPERADGKGLGRHADGIADVMVEAPPMRWLIDQGHLTDYRIVCVKSDLDVLDKAVSASGDWSTAVLRDASARSHIVGDVVQNYLRFAKGLRHVTFATDVETAQKMAAAYRAAGVRAECLTGKTQDAVRRAIIRKFECGELDEIVAVDIISEGFDLPAIEAVSFARPSKSLALIMQQFGRALRVLPGKKEALIIDHVGNLLQPHVGLPDRPRQWTLNSGERSGSKSAVDALPLRVCLECFEPFEAKHRECPHCGFYHAPASRSAPGMVDGDLAEMSPELLEKLRSAMTQATLPLEEERWRLQQTGLHTAGVMGNVKRHADRLETLATLREAMAAWGGKWHGAGETDSMIQRRFYHSFGVDVLSALALKRAEAQALLDRIVTTI